MNAQSHRCIARVGKGSRARPCGKPAKVEHNGMFYCGKHDPQFRRTRVARSGAICGVAGAPTKRSDAIAAVKREIPEQELLRAIGSVVLKWNEFERGFEILFSALLPGNGPYSFAIMQALGGHPARRDMLKVIATYRLAGVPPTCDAPAPDLLDEVNRFLTEADEAAKKRNAIVHGTWFTSDNGPMALLLKARGKHSFEMKPWPTADIIKVAENLSGLRERAITLAIRICERTEDPGPVAADGAA